MTMSAGAWERENVERDIGPTRPQRFVPWRGVLGHAQDVWGGIANPAPLRNYLAFFRLT